MKIKYNILIIIAIFIGITSCNNDETCRKVRYVAMNAYFFNDTVNVNTGDTVSIAAQFDSIIIHGINSDLTDVDSIIKTTNAKYIQLPLNQFENTSTFAIKCNTVIDTLKINYTDDYQFLSLECGTLRVHHLESVTNSSKNFYKIKIVNPDVNVTTTSANAQNISIHHLVD